MRLGVVTLMAISLAVGAAAARASDWEDQLQFGADMAKRGLWAEALFRFERADRLKPNEARTLSNLAVASEALGRFEAAQDYYRRALEVRPSDRDIRGNYDRFLGFYESYQARRAAQQAQSEAAAEESEPTAAPSPAPETADPQEGQS